MSQADLPVVEVPVVEVTVVVVTHAGRSMLPACLDSLAAQSAPHRVLVVDNASSDGTSEFLADRCAAQPPDSDPDTGNGVQVLRLDHNAGFAGGMAAAMATVTTRFVAVLNDDAIAEHGWLAALLAAAAADPDAAAWTSLMIRLREPAVVNNAGGGLLADGSGVDVAAGRPTDTIPVEISDVFAFSGGAALLRTDAVRAVGGFESRYFLYYEDLDLSWRLQLAGWSVRVVPRARVLHRHAATSDPTSVLFHRHNERNRLWTLVRCAPARVVARQLTRFGVTTASLAAKRAVGRQVPPAPNFRVGLRLGVGLETARALPWLLRGRRSVRAGAARRRRAVFDRAVLVTSQW